MTGKLDHVAIRVKDMERAMLVYCMLFLVDGIIKRRKSDSNNSPILLQEHLVH